MSSNPVEPLATRTLRTRFGPIVLFAHGGALVGLEFADQADRVRQLRQKLTRRFGSDGTRAAADPAGAVTRLRAYLNGSMAALDQQPMAFTGTPFQQRVWSALRQIPAGATQSYAEVARRIGRPRAVRAVASANARNPISLFVPCHRVIGANGALCGYGGGIERKAKLLAHERRVARPKHR